MQPFKKSFNRRVDALHSSASKLSINLSADAQLLRRNLLFVSLISVAAFFVEPEEGAYHISLGVISGTLSPEWIVPLGLLSVCLYQLMHFWVFCNVQIFSDQNFIGMRRTYFGELSALIASDSWSEIAKETVGKGTNAAIKTFDPNFGGPTVFQTFVSGSEISVSRLDALPDLKKGIMQDPRFEVSRHGETYTVKYSFDPKKEDYEYLFMHRHMFWLWKKKTFWDYLFPLLMGAAAIVMLFIKTIALALP